ncbi:hypothetical protein BPAE_0134g00170 [Botrytis paeoniae]|uniref:Uncharacterized protein n=1 Tax=Botrytis paeoniae TaxID=278948 RepID=A0A4Z1FL53_9HELO|nr:hypothetical protein BPAE_0134g00170 [Botrytis paeoniae]
MSLHHDDEDIHYSEKAGTAEQQKHATRTYTYESCRPHDTDDKSYMNFKISIQVRNISFRKIRASLVKELIGNIYDRDKAHWKANPDERKPFSRDDTGRTIKWTVDQRNSIAQLYAYDIDGEGRPGDHDHPQGIWMQYNTLLGSGYVFNTTSNPNAREDILNHARELFVHRRPHPKTIEGDWTYVKETGKKSKLDERKHLDHWTNQAKVDGLPWLARARIETKTETIGSGVTLPYKFREYDLQVLNDCTVELDLVILDNLVRDYFSNRSIDPREKEYKRLLINKEDHTSSNKKVWITNYTADQNYQTVRGRLESTSAFNAIVHNESHWKLDWHKKKGQLTLEEMSNGKSKGREHPRSRSRYKRPESETGNESSSSTSGDEILGMGKIRSHRSMPSSFPGYTHSLVESQNSEMTWSGRPEPSNLSSLFIGIHKKDRTVRYYGYKLTNSTRLCLWWDEIADILLSKKIIKPPSAKGPKEKGKLIEEGKMIMIQFDPGSVNPEAGMKYFVSNISNLCDAIQGTPKDSCTHERYSIKTYSLFEYKNSTTVNEQYPSISIRNRLRNKVAYKSILSGLGELLKKPGGDVILAKNKGEIWKLIQKSDGTYLSKPNSTQLRITIHPLAKRQRDTSSSGYYPSSDELQRSRRPESHSAHRRSPSVSSRDSSNQDRTPTRTEYRPRRARSLALSAHERRIRNLPDYIRSREQYRAATSGSSSGVESDVVGQDISFYHHPAAGHGNSTSSTHSHAQTQTEELKRRGSKIRGIMDMAKYLSQEQRQERKRQRDHRSEEKRKNEIKKKEEREKEILGSWKVVVYGLS